VLSANGGVEGMGHMRCVGRRVGVVVAVTLGLVLAACDGDAPAGEPAVTVGAPATTDLDGQSAVSEATAASAPADPTITSAEPVPTTDPAVREVEHALGTTEVPAQPERVVVLDSGTALPVLLSLGVDVVAAPLPDDRVATSLLPAEDLAGVESIGFPEISFERLAAVQPDVVVGLGDQYADRYAELSRIAPTVIVENDLLDWKATTIGLGEAMGLDVEVAAAVADWEADAAMLRSDLGDAVTTEVSVVRALGDRVRIHTRFHFAGQIIDEVGLARPSSQRTEDEGERLIELSLEEIERIDGDVLYVYGAGDFGTVGGDGQLDANVAALQASPLWDTLDVAVTGRVYAVDFLAWQQGGLPAAEIVLDDLRRTLLS